MTKTRLAYVDIGAGTMILWLLLYHAMYPMYGSNRFVTYPFFFFFMPWFFYKSGYFYTHRPLIENAERDARKLLKQFVIWSAIGYVCYIVHHFLLYNDVTLRMAFYTPIRSLLLGGSVWGNSALWFLLTLFCVRQVATYFLPKFKVVYIAVASALLAVAIHFVDYQYLPRIIYTTAWGLFFFLSGYSLRKYEEKQWVIIPSIIIFILTIFCTDIPLVYDMEKTIEWYWYILWYPASLAGCIVFDNICRWVDMSGKKIFRNAQYDMPFPVLKWVGINAMTFYVSHGIICRITQETIAIYRPKWYDTSQGLAIYCMAYLAIVPLCYFINYIKKNE